MRLNKFIAEHGIASRRKADVLIEEGKVRINGAVMRTLGYDVQEGDKVIVNGIPLGDSAKRVYYLLNKPRGYITSMEDPQGRPIVIDLMTDVAERVFPVGRLDYDTSGLLILTNDGELSQRLMHPKHEIEKSYQALIKGRISDEKIRRLEKGVDIGGYLTKPAKLRVLQDKENSSLLEITIKEGRNRQVRKMFKAVGYPVIELKRISIGEIRLGRLLEGHYRKLSAQELAYIKNL